MSATDSDRFRIYEKLTSILGPTDAEILMTQTWPPKNWSELADKRDLEALRLATKGDIGELRHEMTAEFAAVRNEMATMESRMTRSFATLLILSQAGVIAALTMVAAFFT